MLKKGYYKSVLKKALILYAVSTVIVMTAFRGHRLPVLTGLTVGIILAAAKLAALCSLIEKPPQMSNPSSLVMYISSYVLLFLLLLLLSAAIDLRAFAGFAAGLLAVPLAIFATAFTEAFGNKYNREK